MIQFDFTKCGLTEMQISAVSKAATQAHQKLEEERLSQKVGWWRLPFDDATVAQVKKAAAESAKRFENLVVLGIGGSSQGAKALYSALFTPSQKRKLFFLELPDPRSVEQLLQTIDLSKTCFNVVSKSGGTIETLTLFDFFRGRLKKEQIVITTEDGNGKLYQHVVKEGLTHLPIPKNVGGRFSVFSAVGLFPMAFAGVDIESLLNGARKANQESACKNGLIHYLLNKDHGKSISVMMPYADCLYDFGRWYAQLWAESLGKEGKGQTPLAALGPQDQHSLAQLFLDGPKDKVVTFIKVASNSKDPLNKLINKECDATIQALFEKEVPSITITLPDLKPQTLGELLMAYQIQTAFTGHLMGVNSYDQPAVEQIKRLII